MSSSSCPSCSLATSRTFPCSRSRFPELLIVIDHLGKPPLGTRGDDAWAVRSIRSRPPQRAREALGPEHGDRADATGRQRISAGAVGRRSMRSGRSA